MAASSRVAWMSQPRTSVAYIDGVASFLKFVVDNSGGDKLFSCPCTKCRNGKRKIKLDIVSQHLFVNGFDQSYIVWFVHGERTTLAKEQPPIMDGVNKSVDQCDDVYPRMDDLVNDAFEKIGENADILMEDIRREEDDHGGTSEFRNPDDPEVRRYKMLCDDARQLLYRSCPKGLTKLSVTVELYNLKARHAWSDNSFSELLQLVKKLLPEGNTLPDKVYQAKKIIKDLGMTYKQIHVCPNDCILYWKEYVNRDHCPMCHMSRWKSEYLARKKGQRVAAKVLRYFPLTPRLKRLYSVPWIAKQMTWHARSTDSSAYMRHPMDSSIWKGINVVWPDFVDETRNVRLGLATDGFNPFGHLSSAYSCWPVILVPYNLPPSLCMKREFSMLTVLIPEPKGPSKDIDIYLEPLIDELKELWFNGVTTFDSHSNTSFNMKALLMWAIHDFPAYGSLSGCVTHGFYACPICAEGINAERLTSGKKFSYRGHRRFLPSGHVFRSQKAPFNNETEHRKFPRRLSGSEVEKKVVGIHIEPGKSKRKKRKSCDDESGNLTAWYRRSKLFDLPYWKHINVRHNLDVMHIEKNVTDHLLSTILEVKDKTKDGPSAREDLKLMKIKKSLWLKTKDGKTIIPKAPFTLSRKEKEIFCRTLHDLKVPTRYSSTWKHHVNIEHLEIKGLKSHDYHVLMQQLLPVLLRHAFSKHKALRLAIQRICNFFNVLCSKVVNIDDLSIAKHRLVEAMCVLEKYFPPSFFVISIHLMVHLADEALACGPVRFRWMYPFERLLKVYKGYVKNMACPEGCIAERYIAEESVLYCMEYMPNGGRGGHMHTSQGFIDEDSECVDEGPMGKGKSIWLTQMQFQQVRRWVLQCYDGATEWQMKYEIFLRASSSNGQKRKGSIPKESDHGFIPWLRKELEYIEGESTLLRLADGPTFKAHAFNKYRINGFVFTAGEYDVNKSTQNSGVSMKAITKYRASAKDRNYKEEETTYYGVVKKIIELDYTNFKNVVFYCDWVRVEDRTNGCKVDPDTNLILVNMEKFKGSDKEDDEPFILASQANQVFYCKDQLMPKWSVVLEAPKRLTKEVDALEDALLFHSPLSENAMEE